MSTIRVDLVPSKARIVRSDGRDFKPAQKARGKRAFLHLMVRRSEDSSWIDVPMLFDTGSDLSLLPHPLSRGNGETVPSDWIHSDKAVNISSVMGTYVSPLIDVRFAFAEMPKIEFPGKFSFRPDPSQRTRKEQELLHEKQVAKQAVSNSRVPLIYGLLSLSDIVKFFDISTIESGTILLFTHRNGGKQTSIALPQ